jgi:hypothetical protein
MTTYTTMDYKKYICALGSRDIRRIAAKVRRANLENDAEKEIMRLLEQAEARLLVGIFFDGADDTIEDGTSLVDGNLGTYSDCRRVTTTIDWGHGYATVVHHPDPQEQETRQDRRELEEEVWPCGDPEPPCLEPEDDTGEEDVR